MLDYIGIGKTDGVFQLESAGMKGFMKELKPHNLEDVIAGISLYRPGPMDFILYTSWYACLLITINKDLTFFLHDRSLFL